MTPLLAALALLVACGTAAFLAAGNDRLAARIGALGPVGACLLALGPAISVIIDGEPVRWVRAWPMPMGSFALLLDPLAGWILLPVLLLSALAAIYGIGYLAHEKVRRRAGRSWLWYNLLVASMLVVGLAGNALLFLIAWEMMALASFFLVGYGHDKPRVRHAAWTYLIATHLGAAPLLLMFLLCGAAAGSLDFAAFAGTLTPALAGVCFLLAFIGFGTKAGIMPFHVWLPEAHPAAPSHVSALMSGVMIKTGLYALLRTLTWLGAPPLWWGMVLLAAGAVSAVLGIIFALAQHDLKRLLAYCSVENVGIILLGFGTGLIGLSCSSPIVAGLGFAGGLLHLLNHACSKGLLFLGAGAVIHNTGTGELDRLGGLLKKMPVTGGTFLTGAAAIVGLPPLSGFVSEFLIFLAMLAGMVKLAPAAALPLTLGIIALALTGGLAAACFAKAGGIMLLGEPRSAEAARGHDPGLLQTAPLLMLAAACGLLGIFGPLVMLVTVPVVAQLAGSEAARQLADAIRFLQPLTACALTLAGLTAALAALRWRLLRNRSVRQAVTWDCGYAAPAASMQYTASSFAQPLTYLFRDVLRTRTQLEAPDWFFPASAKISTSTPDLGRERLYRPLFNIALGLFARLRAIQEGHLQTYVLYIVLTLLALLAWNLQ